MTQSLHSLACFCSVDVKANTHTTRGLGPVTSGKGNQLVERASGTVKRATQPDVWTVTIGKGNQQVERGPGPVKRAAQPDVWTL